MLRVSMGLLVDDAGRVLLGLRAPHKPVLPGRWDAIGGRVEPMENDEEALRREIREELGVTPTLVSLLAFGPRPSQGESGPYWLSLFAVTEWSGGEPINCSDEHVAVGWFSSAEISKLTNLANLDYVQLSRMAARPIGARSRDV